MAIKRTISVDRRKKLERFFSADAWKGKGSSAEAFEPLAKLITTDPPPWLKGLLHSWSGSVMSAYAVESLQPTRAEMRAMLAAIADAAPRLVSALSSAAVVEFLDLGGEQALYNPGEINAVLVDIRDRAASAAQSPALVTNGKTNSGRGRAAPKESMSPQTYCALLIAETWIYFHDAYPAPRNKQAQEAADIFWRLSGGLRVSGGQDKLIAWRSHIQRALKDQSGDANALREEFRRHLRLSARMASAPEEAADGK
ncbi:MAG: hypothetical protein KGM15_00905 [Pseudomonadota bacterium]|nr:hypothetical protein [Pseudomonadota bacterium]